MKRIKGFGNCQLRLAQSRCRYCRDIDNDSGPLCDSCGLNKEEQTVASLACFKTGDVSVSGW
jgi:hypothetical protein